ncbi:MAG: hypothetical protein O0V67_02200 [Methanocorpusculum sp.]|nr:hypothetical protein [Methanocorpusculum sp.]
MKNYFENFLCVLLAMMLLPPMALPVMADENIPAVSDIENEAKLLNPAEVVPEPTFEEVGVNVASIIVGPWPRKDVT